MPALLVSPSPTWSPCPGFFHRNTCWPSVSPGTAGCWSQDVVSARPACDVKLTCLSGVLPSEVPWSPWVKLLPPRRPSDGHRGPAWGSAPCLLPPACFLGSPASKSLQIHLQSVPEPAWSAPGSLDLSGQPLSCALRSRALRARRPSPQATRRVGFGTWETKVQCWSPPVCDEALAIPRLPLLLLLLVGKIPPHTLTLPAPPWR